MVSRLPVVVAFSLPVLLQVCWGAASTQPCCPSVTVAGAWLPGWPAVSRSGCPGSCPAEFGNSPWQSSAPNGIIPAAAGNERWLESCHPFGYANRELCRRAIWVLFYFCLISCQHVYTVQSLSLAIVLPWLHICGGVYHREGRVRGCSLEKQPGEACRRAAFPRGSGKPPSQPGIANPMRQRRKQKSPTRKSAY